MLVKLLVLFAIVFDCAAFFLMGFHVSLAPDSVDANGLQIIYDFAAYAWFFPIVVPSLYFVVAVRGNMNRKGQIVGGAIFEFLTGLGILSFLTYLLLLEDGLHAVSGLSITLVLVILCVHLGSSLGSLSLLTSAK